MKITLTFFRMHFAFSLLPLKTAVSNSLSRDARPSIGLSSVHPTHRGASRTAATSNYPQDHMSFPPNRRTCSDLAVFAQTSVAIDLINVMRSEKLTKVFQLHGHGHNYHMVINHSTSQAKNQIKLCRSIKFSKMP